MKRYYHLLVTGCILVLALALVSPVMATAPLVRAPAPAGVQGTCGDGVCDAYTNENAVTCPADCAPSGGGAVTPQPTVPGLLLPNVVPTSQPTQPPADNASTTDVQIPTSTAQPGSSRDVAAIAPETGCGLVAYSSRPAGWQRAYTGSSNNFIPKTAQEQEVFVCDEQAVGQICIPMYDGLMTAAQGKLDQVVLVDCGADGKCAVHKPRIQPVGGNLCATVTAADNVHCSIGCAFVPQSFSFLGLTLPEFARDLFASQVALPAICLAGVFLVGFIGLIVFARRRKPSKEAPSTEPCAGVEST